MDAIVVGAGPNGLAAAVTLARAGLSVRVYEGADTIGGASATAALTLPGFMHDVCSAVHPMVLSSQFFRDFGLTDRVQLVSPEISYAHPLDGGRAAIAYRDLDRTAEQLGRDGDAWRRLFAPLVERVERVSEFIGASMLRIPRSPITAARFGLRVLEQGSPAWNARWRDELAPAMLTGVFAHTIQRMPSLGSAAAGMVLATHAHAAGWPIPVGGSQAIVDAMAAEVIALGGEIVTGETVGSLDELPPARAVLLDTSTRSFLNLAGSRVPSRYSRRLRRFRFGNAAAKVDFALSGPVPWAAPELAAAGTVHVGGTRRELAHAEAEVAAGRHPERPYVLVSQPSVVDPGRAPAGNHTLWTYTHVPRGSTADVTEAITRQIERFAPGFRDVVLASSSSSAAELERYNPNYVGGDIASGDVDAVQLLARPVLSRAPWRTPVDGVYLCSSATPPGPGVHGMAGFHAARLALRDRFGIRADTLAEIG
jgi:phytoene dehydrogenase-like protein